VYYLDYSCRRVSSVNLLIGHTRSILDSGDIIARETLKLILIFLHFSDIENTYSYEDISKSFRTRLITKYMLTLLLVIVVTFKVVPFHVYATGPAFLPLLEAPL
jgi:hypothetical protein